MKCPECGGEGSCVPGCPSEPECFVCEVPLSECDCNFTPEEDPPDFDRNGDPL